jgi:SH3 domain (SH3b1 type)/NLPC_P60 stabilising domain, N term/SH3 domain of SH3b2 type
MLKTLGLYGAILISTSVYADDLISLFPIENYDQTIADFIDPGSPDYDQPLLSPTQQQERMEDFYSHYFSSSGTDQSPWNGAYINSFYQANPPHDIKSIELSVIDWLTNKGKPQSKISYGANFRPHTDAWMDDTQANMNLNQFTGSHYQENRRGITITNLAGRVLPFDDPHFYSHKLPGQGYPFDNDQQSAIWAGTPVYVAGLSLDGKWALIITPDVFAWVHSNGVAYADRNFVSAWQTAASHKLAAITKTEASVYDQRQKQRFRFSAYVGSVFPLKDTYTGKLQIMIPTMGKNHRAKISTALLNSDEAAPMPLAPTPHNFANLIKTMQGRPYGWGSYNFYNDCSAETKSIVTPFAIYLMRHSSEQIKSGKVVDESSAAMNERLQYLTQNGHKLMTIVYIGGHVFLYIGNTARYGATAPMVYQSIWGLSPTDYSRRSVIGETVLFPLLTQYPEDPTLVSLAAKKYFQVSFLDQWQPTLNRAANLNDIDLKAIMLPEGMLDEDNSLR